MDSEGDDDFYYSDEESEETAEDGRPTDGLSGDGGGEEEDDGIHFVPINRPQQKHYKTLKEEEIQNIQQNYISDVCNVLSVSRGVACTLLCQNNWMASSVYDRWFDSIDQSVDDPHLEPVSKQISSSSQVCKICCETIVLVEKNMLSAGCGHLFCVDCWTTYISMSVKDGPGCLTLCCPEPGCKFHPGLDMVEALASADDKDKYYRYLCRSYVESNRKKRKWCPAPGCDFAIEFNAGGRERESYEVTCDCGYKLCWNCCEESHSPLYCDTVTKWMEKNKTEEVNTAWVLAYTKPCPKCRRPIQKNQGCNHMTCGKPCGFEFCWTCLSPWTEHGYAKCNKYKDEAVRADKGKRIKAKKDLVRYTHYYERWHSNDKSRKRALSDLNTARNERIDRLIRTQQESHAHLKFVIDAWGQIVECRRVLKWTYAYGYYLLLSGSGKLDFFEHLQGEAEAALERLHHCAEKEMGKYLLANCPSKDFKAFRFKLAGLTSVTKNYFENLVRALENNLSEVEIADSKKRKRSQVEKSGTKTRKSSKNWMV